MYIQKEDDALHKSYLYYDPKLAQWLIGPHHQGSQAQVASAESARACPTGVSVWDRTSNGKWEATPGVVVEAVCAKHGDVSFHRKKYPAVYSGKLQDFNGDDVKFTSYQGDSEEEKDVDCSKKCDAEPKCTFWVRDTKSRSCWLKKNFRGIRPSGNHRANFKKGHEPVYKHEDTCTTFRGREECSRTVMDLPWDLNAGRNCRRLLRELQSAGNWSGSAARRRLWVLE
jgi:hypothetical protein